MILKLILKYICKICCIAYDITLSYLLDKLEMFFFDNMLPIIGTFILIFYAIRMRYNIIIPPCQTKQDT